MNDEDILKLFDKKKRDEESRQKKYGKINPIIHISSKGIRFVAVDNKLYYSSKWATFPDFLLEYIWSIFGEDWFNIEKSKTQSEQHPVMQWRYSISEFQKYQKKNTDGLYYAVPSGPFKAFITLAYDLYLLEHHSKLQNVFIDRIKDINQFQGARYELFVVTTLIRTGFEIYFEDESDRGKKHVELIAEHKISKDRVAIEAKSKHRHGVLGLSGIKKDIKDIRVRVGRLINSAISKYPGIPYLIFIDLNLPPDKMDIFDDPTLKELINTIKTIEVSPDEKDYFNAIFYTNFPYHYGDDLKKYPEDHLSAAISQKPLYPLKNNLIIRDLQITIKNYGQIPNQFPE